jgi:preprotein translocase subunit YajC
MSALLGELPVLLAQDVGGSGYSMLLFFGVFAGTFYFLILRPQQQQERKRRSMIDALKKNDKVLTTGGIYGTVISVDGKADRVVIRVDDEKGVKMAFTKASVSRVIEPSSEKPAESS